MNIFNQSKYTKWYFKIIEHAKKSSINGYFEIHHIVPRCMGGSNSSENLIKLSARQHYICHLLLTKMTDIYKNKMIFALWRMMHGTTNQKRYVTNNHQYQIIKEKMSKTLSEINSGKTLSDEHKNKLKEKIPWNKGRTGVMSEEARNKISNFRKSKLHSLETKNKISESIKKQHESKKYKNKNYSKNRKSRKLTDEQRKTLSDAMKLSWSRRKSW